MSEPVAATRPRSTAVIIGLVVALTAGFGLGLVAGGSTGADQVAAEGHTHASGSAARAGSADDHHGAGTGSAGGVGHAGGDAAGLAISAAGFRLVAEQTTLPVGTARPLRFRIVDTDRRAVTRFAVLHDKPMHLIIARRDLSHFLHLHPSMAPDGTWSLPLALPEPGVWRAYADFTATTVDGDSAAAVLGVDLTVAGDFQPRSLPRPARQTTAAGFDVRYAGEPRVGSVQPLLFEITKAGAPATLQRYLGAYGHLVVLREGDLGYVHVHPEAELVDGTVKFWLTAPSPGRYRMFLDFQVAGAVHTAAFTMVVS